MAEYHLSFADVLELINNNLPGDCCISTDYKPEILAAITGNTDNPEMTEEFVSLWDNQIIKSSELLLGTRYIRLSDLAICFIEVALSSGLLDFIIDTIVNGDAHFSVSLSTSIVMSIRNLFSNVCSLDDWDFCVYMQAVTHFRKHKEFTREELLQWVPAIDTVCNMHNSKWDCVHYKKESDMCGFKESNRVDDAINSLCKKNILKPITEKNDTYKFVL